jgi:hypothetical protein
MSATGSFDPPRHRRRRRRELMQAFKRLVENPLGMLA